ncbi:class I SAM-dependent methyltransferase [Saccharothrix yanglingensis]|uniref:SAM-dependent methyltransferase n=1 Tax=Saccharothrix yanglingensis TaxID=659496 RepID=A0ABU0WYM6_9PSEU|nr:class I SAM-dependent methyltransferase [Saccharothrix yanglingensis]MDQ2584951.1 SAM-dependent methyltransferase [Saccharothrix yanglingensis]
MSCEDPRAYLLGIEGMALLRAFTGEFDRDFVEARIAEIRRVLADEELADAAVEVDRLDAVAGYRLWSKTYDRPNSAFDLDEPLVRGIIDSLPVGVALDAACGTGRHARFLAERGHRVLGVDGSPDMLARARASVPRGEFLLGDLHRLPVADAEVDLVVCALALTHVPALAPVIAEFARVLRPGGHLVISDVHPERVARGSIPSVRDAEGRPARVSTHHHLIGDYLRAALPVGLRVLRCEEPSAPTGEPSEPTPPTSAFGEVGPWDLWPWCLADMVPEAARAAVAGVPALVVWHFRLAES